MLWEVGLSKNLLHFGGCRLVLCGLEYSVFMSLPEGVRYIRASGDWRVFVVPIQGGAEFPYRQSAMTLLKALLLPKAAQATLSRDQEVCWGELCSPGPCRTHFFQA